jgi:hypothetical protein
MVLAGPLRAAPVALQQAYPETRRDPVVETRFGQNVADPWRWLEADMRTSPEVADWVARENSLTAGFLARLPGRDAFAARIQPVRLRTHFAAAQGRAQLFHPAQQRLAKPVGALCAGPGGTSAPRAARSQ